MQRPQGSASGEPGPPRWPVVNISSPLKPLREPLSTRKAASHARVSSDHSARLPRKVTPWWVKSDPARSSGALLRLPQIRHYTRSRRQLAPALAADPRGGLIDLSCWRNDVPPQIGYCSVLATVRSQIQVLFRSQ